MHPADARTEAQEMMEQSAAWAANTICSGVTLTACCGRGIISDTDFAIGAVSV